jgi:methylated-DNA-protein-cysteine methyltransferase related protein
VTPAFDRAVYRVVRRVPRGAVVTYGQVAAMVGHPRAARAVGRALRALGERRARIVPWHRVVNAGGRVSPRDLFWADVQRERLEEEGVRFDAGGRIDLRRVRWSGAPSSRRPAVTARPRARGTARVRDPSLPARSGRAR